ncbi:hypothetical protein POM88_047162 [Heracleum sosnowskyi]|uniref:F-box protein n=1 Tax=Heracleum sosnowskyi TaxID=360622 RepID=A0AAD8M862_9APIA|nr:hypothetical protein POM88_047162 [Heracleum sosnowskyi]
MARKKKVKIRREDNGGDKISQLPDEMIHKILSFSDARYSKKIPKNSDDECKFIDHVLSRRDDQSPIKKLKLSVVHWGSRWIIDWFRDYALSHKVESLQIDSVDHLVRHNLSSYASQSLKQLKLAMSVKFGTPFEQDMWSLPALTTLDLTCLTSKEYKLPLSCLICLFSLQTLHLNSFDLPQSFSLLSLKTLFLARCNLPQGPCKLPALLTLELHDVAEVAFSAAVGGDGDGQVRSSREDGDTGLWQGHKVNSEFVGLLDLIMKKYPETFEYFTTNTESKLFCTMKLNMLCTSVDAFSKISTTEVDDKMVTEHKVVFAELQKLGFKVNWLASHLNCIERGISKSLMHD